MAAWWPGWKMLTFVGLFLPLLLVLGNWQIDRAHYKQQLQAQFLDRSISLPSNPGDGVLTDEAGEHDFRPVVIDGTFMLDRHFLVDNQIVEGQPGYWVISPFRDVNSRVWLVNRGWIAALASRTQLPSVPTPSSVIRLRGLMWPFTGLVPLLDEGAWADTADLGDRSLLRVQRLDIATMAQDIQSRWPELAVVPMELRLEPSSQAVFAAAPQLVVGSADRHYGYAVTWFGLAVALVIGFGLYCWRLAKLAGAADNSINGRNDE